MLRYHLQGVRSSVDRRPEAVVIDGAGIPLGLPSPAEVLGKTSSLMATRLGVVVALLFNEAWLRLEITLSHVALERGPRLRRHSMGVNGNNAWSRGLLINSRAS